MTQPNHQQPSTISLIEGTVHSSKGEKSAFKVALNFEGLRNLIEDAKNLRGIYELFQIRRPGDIWDYVVCELIDVPAHLLPRRNPGFVERPDPQPDRPRANPATYRFRDFDSRFHANDPDNDPEDWFWLRHRTDSCFPDLARQWFDVVQAAQSELDNHQSPIAQHILPFIRKADHPFDYLPGKLSPTEFRTSRPASPQRSADYYAKLAGVIADPAIQSIAALGDNDPTTNRMIFEEQRRRANRQNCTAKEALPICLATDAYRPFDEWMAFAAYFDEGIGGADLLINCPPGHILKHLAESPRPNRTYLKILTPGDAGELRGYRKEASSDWAYYELESVENLYIHKPLSWTI